MRYTHVCTTCHAGWWNDRPTDTCPTCGKGAEIRGTTRVLPLTQSGTL